MSGDLQASYLITVSCMEPCMPLIAWKDDYSVNNEILDNHHKELFRIINELYDDCLNVDNVNCLGPKLDDLVSYSKYHINAEEQFMKDKGYKDYENHIVLHSQFVRKINDVYVNYPQNELEASRDLIIFLGNWILNHIIKEDLKYSQQAISPYL